MTDSLKAAIGDTATITVRLASADDAELVDRLVREIADHEGSLHDVSSGPADWRRMLARDDVKVLLAFDDAGPVGYVSTVRRLSLWLGQDIVGIDDLWVRDVARDRGVGRRLMAEVAALAAPESQTVVWGVRLDNEAAHRFYRRLGANLSTKVVATWLPHAYAATVSTTTREHESDERTD